MSNFGVSAKANRREFIKKIGFCLGASAVSFTSDNIFEEKTHAHVQRTSQQTTGLILKKIPHSGELIPAVGLGSFLTFDVLPGEPRNFVREVIRRFWEGGGRVFDTSPLYGTGEISIGDFATDLGINKEMFIANKVWSTGDFLADNSHAQRSLDQSLQRLWRDKFDLLQIHSLVNVDALLPVLRSWKQEGRIRYIGVTHHEEIYFPALTQWIEKGDVDFVQVHYSIHTRLAEERLLNVARDRGTAVLVNMPFEKARLFKVVEGHTVPDFAREVGIENWAQFFLKWVISHPSVTCVIPATANPDHQSENIGALKGSLPDPAMRARMLRHMESIPGFNRLGKMPWYPGKQFKGVINQAQRLRQTK